MGGGGEECQQVEAAVVLVEEKLGAGESVAVALEVAATAAADMGAVGVAADARGAPSVKEAGGTVPVRCLWCTQDPRIRMRLETVSTVRT